QKVGVQFMSQVAYLIPIFAIVWSWVFFDELPKAIAIVALLLILAGLFIRKIKFQGRKKLNKK
ncbi:MAG: EamA family transporter, partial [Campylobacteraceae bacterium]|nr:EamA family transporter [Campylobacteraceae bacterium]